MKNKITCIKKNKSNDKFSIFINNEFAFSISGTDVLYFKLKENDEIFNDKIQYIMDNTIFNEARDKALNFLGYKARTYKEVVDKLMDNDYPEETIYNVMELLTKYSYVDDYKYATSYTKYMHNAKSYGKIRIKFELKQKGVPNNIIDKVFEELNLDETDNIMMLLDKKLKNSTDIDYKEKKRVFDYIARRGYYYEDINSAFQTYKEGYN